MNLDKVDSGVHRSDMPRTIRVEYAGACYHVINRGNYRRNVFQEAGAAEAFVRTLGEAALRFGWRVHAYVVMRNHFHLAVELTEPNLSEAMKWLQGTWTRRYNGFRRLVGRPFQGRYKALLVEPGHALSQVCHYIHLNPERACAVPNGKLAEYRWSSLIAFPQKKRAPWLVSSSALGGAGELRDTAKGWANYLEFLQHLSEDATAQAELCAQKMSRGWCIGSPDFKRSIKREMAEKGAELDIARYAGLEPDEVRRERHDSWSERLDHAARIAGIDLTKLPAKKSASEKVLLAAVMKQTTSVSNGWLAERLGLGKPASASQFVRRLMLEPEGRARVQRLLSRVKT